MLPKDVQNRKKNPRELKVLAHNGTWFDFKLIIAALADYCDDNDLKVLGKSTESIMSFTIENINDTGVKVRFHSKKHLSEPMENLTNSLSNNFHNKNCEDKRKNSIIYYHKKAFRCNKCNKKVTAWKVSKYGVISGPYFPAFGLNTERYKVSLCIQSKCGKIRTRDNSLFGHFSRGELIKIL